MVSFNDVLIAAKEYCKNQMVDATYRLYIEKLQLVSFEDSSIITLSIENEFLCGIVNDRYLNLLRDAFKSVLGFEAEVRVISQLMKNSNSMMKIKSFSSLIQN